MVTLRIFRNLANQNYMHFFFILFLFLFFLMVFLCYVLKNQLGVLSNILFILHYLVFSLRCCPTLPFVKVFINIILHFIAMQCFYTLGILFKRKIFRSNIDVWQLSKVREKNQIICAIQLNSKIVYNYWMQTSKE